MNRVLPIILVLAAVVLHFMYCEWEIRDSRTVGIPSASENARLIFYHHSRLRNVTLYARPSEDKQVATIYGVLLPVLLLAAAGLMQHFQRNTGRSRAQFTPR